MRAAAGRPRRVGGTGGVQVSVRRVREGSTDPFKAEVGGTSSVPPRRWHRFIDRYPDGAPRSVVDELVDHLRGTMNVL